MTRTPEQYYKLYETAAKAIKDYDPNVKVGGPVLAESMRFLEGFLAYCQSRHVPLDFVPGICITPNPRPSLGRPKKSTNYLSSMVIPTPRAFWTNGAITRAIGARGRSKEINSIGDPKVVDGVAQEVQGAAGAAFDASVLTLLQDSTVNIANFYHGTTVVLWGMFSHTESPTKPITLLKLLNRSLKLPSG